MFLIDTKGCIIRCVKRSWLGNGFAVVIYLTAIALSLLSLSAGGDILTIETENGTFAYSLNENGIHSFDGPLGITEIEIKDGKARVISSPCRNGLCMKAGWSNTLCCLPNRIIATTNSPEGGVDAISG